MVIRMRHTRSHTKNRRSHHALSKPRSTKDASGSVHMRHRMNSKTGMYRGRLVLDVLARSTKKSQKKKTQKETTQKESTK